MQLKESYMPSWSRDGSKLAFISSRTGNYQIWTMNPDGTEQRQVTDGKTSCFYPSWSPDGKKLAFQSLDPERNDYDVYVVNSDGTGLTQITDSPYDEEWPAWSPDGSRILYQAELPDGKWGGPDELWTATPDGRERTRLTDNLAHEFQPAWSPDGSRIAFVSTRDTPPGDERNTNELYLMDADGKNPRRVTREGTEGAYNPAWSPDGRRLAYTRGRKNPEIATIHVDGTGCEVLTSLPTQDMWPEWSPDGKSIAFTSWDARKVTGELRRIDLETHRVSSVLENPMDDWQPHYSPDGKQLAFHSTRDDEEGRSNDVFVCDVKGKQLRRLTPYPYQAG